MIRTTTFLFTIVLVFNFSTTITAIFFNQELNVTRFDISHLTRNVIYPKDDKIVVLHTYSDEFVLLGARNRVYNISLRSMKEVDRYEWSTSDSARQNCAAISQNPIVCDNYIRTYFELTRGQFILCGTHGLQPSCAEFTFGNSKPERVVQVVGMSPVDADSTAPFIRSNENIITVNVAELSSSEPLLIRRNVIKMWRGIENDVILRTPRGQSSFEQANFLKMFKFHKNEVMFFFSESPMDFEGCGLHKVARIGRVCDDDEGGKMSYKNEWSSYSKARIECSIEEENEDTFYFNQFASISETPTSFYGSFRSQLAGIGASAICKYDKTSISMTMASSYKNQLPNTCARATTIEELTKIRLNPLIKQKVSAHPIYVFHGKDRFTHVIAQENIKDLSNQSYDILYIATNLGNILKVVIPIKDGVQQPARHALTLRVLPPSTKIVDMNLYHENLPNNMTYSYLVIVTDHSILKIPTTTCNLASNCAECLSSGDPQCGWADAGECIDTNAEGLRTKYASQDSGTCNLNVETKPVSIPPLKPKEQPSCLCETTSSLPCTTEVIQKEIIQYASTDFWKYIATFAAGLVIGSLFNCVYFYFNRKSIEKSASSRSSSSMTRPISSRQPIDAFTTSSLAEDMFSSTNSANRFNTLSMHSSIRTYC